jgi:hypothetical protein
MTSGPLSASRSSAGRKTVRISGRGLPAREETKPRLLLIAQRSIGLLIGANAMGDIYRTYTLARRDGVAFNLQLIGEDFTQKAVEPFDAAYMKALFDHGYAKGLQGRWLGGPPGFLATQR